MDVLLVAPGPRLDDAVAALREAAGVYGWSVSWETDGAAARVRVVPGTCTRRPEALRVLERLRTMDAGLAADVSFVRTPAPPAPAPSRR